MVPEKLVAAVAALVAVAAVTWLYGHTRTGLAAARDRRRPAGGRGDGDKCRPAFGLVWAMTGVVSVAAGILWVLVSGGGFGVALVGLTWKIHRMA